VLASGARIGKTPAAMKDAYDELASGQGAFRPHWRDLMATLGSLPPELIAERATRARAHFAEADEFLAIYGRQPDHPTWSFDLLPMILPEAEWDILAAGLTQRARLLDLVLDDIYGEQRLIREGALPPYLVYANPEFLRPMRRPRAGGEQGRLHFYAADVVRVADGSWRIFADRTQAPAGIGYALRNRRVLARTFPEAFRAVPVRRLRPFVELWQSSLLDLGGRRRDDPRAVLLTPGPYNPAYFEHVYLARELGLTLARGADLTVRDAAVYLKTLDGLMPVDVIYRRVDGAWCDPLELREDSTLGLAGLIEAERSGNVVIVNLPGSAAIETPAFAPFLPALSRLLLGEPLKLPAVTTWWCGQSAPLAEVRDNLGRFLFRPVFATDPIPVDVTTLGPKERKAFEADLLSHPERFVAIERVAHGLVPTLGEGGMAPQPVVLRVALVRSGDDWVAMPGGVARVVAGDSLYRGTLRHGGIAKDVWVLTTEEQDVYVPAAGRRSPAILRATGALQSRAADDLFWLGRYTERIDGGARLFRAAIGRLSGGGLGARDMAELQLLAQALSRNGWIESTVAHAPVDGSMFASGLTGVAADGGALRDALVAVRQLAFAVRDRLSLDMWQSLNHMLTDVRGALARGNRDADRLLDALDGLVRSIAAFGGLVAENMTRGSGWRFLEMGRRLERGIGIARTIAGVLDVPPRRTDIGLRLALELCDSTITYRTRYPTEPRLGPALDLVLVDGSNPRALLFQLADLRQHLTLLATEGAERQQVEAMIVAIEHFPLADLETGRETVDAAPAVALLDDLVGRLMTLSDLITRNFFSHIDVPHILTIAAPVAAEMEPA